MERREGAGRERWHGPLEEIGGAIENGIITAALMTPQACATVVRSRSKSHPVSVSDNPQPTRKVHGDLARQCHLCPSA
jgi:hypothetical protein